MFCLSAGLVLYQGNLYFLTSKFWAETEIVKDRECPSDMICALTVHKRRFPGTVRFEDAGICSLRL